MSSIDLSPADVSIILSALSTAPGRSVGETTPCLALASKIYHALKAELDPGPLGSGWTTTPTVWQASSQNSGNGVPSAPHVNVDEDSGVQGLATPSRTFNSTREPAASCLDWASSFPPVPFPPGQETSDRISQEDYSVSLDYSQYENEPACHSVIPLALNDDTVDYELLGHSLQGYSNHSQAGPLQCDIHIPQSHSSVPPTTSLPTPMHTPTRSRPLMSNSGLLDANPSQTPAVLTAVVRWSFPERRTINCELFLNGQPVSPSLADLPSQPGPQEDNPMACDVPSDAEGSGGGEQGRASTEEIYQWLGMAPGSNNHFGRQIGGRGHSGGGGNGGGGGHGGRGGGERWWWW
ncbi:hypothetical protein CPB84DRAFT_1852584 [Gymnopilus junonius]|uniref:Uncharacterized protein n=1 Tax=Gymnopilus junonius TaxID=109634 RepID=A0A9P5NDT0_GYMJU|nr:hypothetical protein CPB84DRAFT_1852584 [Gymnopilus junonius]